MGFYTMRWPMIKSHSNNKYCPTPRKKNNGHFASDNLDEACRTGDSRDTLNTKGKPLNAESLYPLKLKTLR